MTSISSKVGLGKRTIRLGASTAGLVALNVLAVACSTAAPSGSAGETLGSEQEAIHDPNEPLCAPAVDPGDGCCGYTLPNSIDGSTDVYNNTDNKTFLLNLRAEMPLFAPHASPFDETVVSTGRGWPGHGAVDYGKTNVVNNDASFEVRSVAEGRVVTVTWDNAIGGGCCGMGNTVVVEHTAPSGEKYRSVYAHLRNGAKNDCLQSKAWVDSGGAAEPYISFVNKQTCPDLANGIPGNLDPNVWGTEETTLKVKVGDMVKQGQPIGMSGSTGQGGIQLGLDPAGNPPPTGNVHLHLFFAVEAPEVAPAIAPNARWINVDPYGAYENGPNGSCLKLGANTEGHRLFAPFYPTFAGVTSENLAHYLDYYPSMGYAAQTMSIYPSGSAQLSAGSFQPGLSPEWLSRIGRFRADFQNDLTAAAAQDLQLREIQVSSLQGGDIRYNGIWTRRTASNSNTVIDLDDTTWAATIQGEVQNGRRPTDEFTYQINGLPRHAGIFAADGVPSSLWNLAWNRTLTNFNSFVAQEATAGRKPTSVSAESPADATYGGFFHGAQGDWVVEPSITGGVSGFNARNDFHTSVGQDRRLYRVQGYGDGQKFAAIWVKNELKPDASFSSTGMTTCVGPGGSNFALNGSFSGFDPAFPIGYEWTGPFGVLHGPIANVTLPLGPSTTTLRVYDSRGYESRQTLSINVQQDVTGPTLVAPPALTITRCTNVNLGTPTFSDDCPGNVTVTNNAPAKFPLGTTTVTWTARDQLGNVSTATQLVTANLGDDTSCCPAGTNIIQGTSNNDTLNGTSGSDCILGRGAQDTINGNRGNDFISGGDGDDTIHGNAGNDRLYGGSGQDHLFGDADTDFIQGGDGDDECRGGIGNDEVRGGNGNDRIFGEDGNDACFGEDGDDRLEGGAGNDSLNGGGLHDTCVGGPGADTFALCQSATQ